MTKVNDGGPAFAAWPRGGFGYDWGRITKRTEKTVTVHEWQAWGGGQFGVRGLRKPITDCVLFDSEAEARALVAALTDLYNREADTRRQYAKKRRELIETARAMDAEQSAASLK